MGECMTFEEAVHAFDSVTYDQADYPDQVGTVRYCGLPVVMRSSRLECLECRRAIAIVARQWIVAAWGSKGIKIHGWPTPDSALGDDLAGVVPSLRTATREEDQAPSSQEKE